MGTKKTIDDMAVADLRVLMRVDFNVPLGGDVITDDRRIVAALPSIRSVIDRGGKLILMSHLGRPKGVGPETGMSLAPVARHLGKVLEAPVRFVESCVGRDAEEAAARVGSGQVLMLENLRFHSEETLIDKAARNPDGRLTDEQRVRIDGFTAKLARHGDLYCNNAFGTCHRKHVSMYDVPLRLGAGRRVCGGLVADELRFLGESLQNPSRPFVTILGGAKVSDKIGVIRNLLPRVDTILIGGAMAYTFFAAQGRRIGRSLSEPDKLDMARNLLAEANVKIVLPLDSVCAAALVAGAPTQVVTGDIPDDLMGLDVGPRTVDVFAAHLHGAKTIIWNGPMGVFETPPFDRGTIEMARVLSDATAQGATTIIGGGDSAAAVEAAGCSDRMTHISTGGGATLEFLEGRPFETIEILDDA